jgi:hypothetical protein
MEPVQADFQLSGDERQSSDDAPSYRVCQHAPVFGPTRFTPPDEPELATTKYNHGRDK